MSRASPNILKERGQRLYKPRKQIMASFKVDELEFGFSMFEYFGCKSFRYI